MSTNPCFAMFLFDGIFGVNRGRVFSSIFVHGVDQANEFCDVVCQFLCFVLGEITCSFSYYEGNNS